ncbi:MAG TPA: hypothetical protein VJS44_07465 [Pyrinomonadaceae bacterium]|nr:hypothetical protein [Pyrinomonadaceae bacterium]
MSEQEQGKYSGVNFDGEPLEVEDVQNLESNIIRRIAMRFLNPQERASIPAPAGSGMRQGVLSVSGGSKESVHDSDPHDSDPHDKDVHDRLNFDRDNFNRA